MFKKLTILLSTFLIQSHTIYGQDDFDFEETNYHNDEIGRIFPDNLSQLRNAFFQIWPINFLKSNFKPLREYDFIIVGAGPAGCVLANRLTENPDTTVLLLEAGRPDLPQLTDVPLSAPNLQSTTYNWGYETEPQPRACHSMKGSRCKWPHGRGLGGSSLINYMIYTRGNRRDFDSWNNSGNPGWSYEEVLPYFIKSEDSQLGDFNKNGYHGYGGPVNVEYPPFRSKISEAFLKSAQEAGYDYIDYNAREQIGVSPIQATTKGGWRFTASEAYLEPVRRRTNLHISSESWVTKIVLNKGTKTAKGVHFVRNKQDCTVKAKREVILSAGAFESPKLLMLSGIGPSDDLTKLGINVVKDLPVGKTLYEHMAVFGPIFTIQNGTDGLININDVITPEVILKFYSGEGPLTSNGIESLMYIKTNISDNPDPGLPDVEIMQAMATISFDTAPGTRRSVGLTKEAYSSIFKPLENQRSFQFLPMLLHPKSKGFLKLKSTNPFKHPVFYPNFFDDSRDVDTLLAAIRESIRISNQKSLQHLGLKLYEAKIPGCEDNKFNSDDYWKCYIMHLSASLHHQIGTCKMGPISDPSAVVDSSLKVIGIKGLRVVDVSIIPEPPSGHTAAYSYMIGEKAADMIKKEWKITAVRKYYRGKRDVQKFDWQKGDDSVEYNFFRMNKNIKKRLDFGFNLTTTERTTTTTTTTENAVKALRKLIQASEDEIKRIEDSSPKTKKSHMEQIIDGMPSINEDELRTFNLPNGTTYGMGRNKAKYITAELAKMNFTEYHREDFRDHLNLTVTEKYIKIVTDMIMAESNSTSVSMDHKRIKRTLHKKILSNLKKSLNHGAFKTSEYFEKGKLSRGRRHVPIIEKEVKLKQTEHDKEKNEVKEFFIDRWKEAKKFSTL